MSELLKRVRVGREQWITASGSEWRIRRPTLHEFVNLRKDANALIKHALVDWKVRELDLVPGGTDQTPPFDADVALEWLQDRPELYSAVLDAIYAAVMAFVQAKEDAAGKSSPP
jgi:hypothetical protein